MGIASIPVTYYYLGKALATTTIRVRFDFASRDSRGCYPLLIQELRLEDPEAFRGFLLMDRPIETFDYLLQRLENYISGSTRFRQRRSAGPGRYHYWNCDIWRVAWWRRFTWHMVDMMPVRGNLRNDGKQVRDKLADYFMTDGAVPWQRSYGWHS